MALDQVIILSNTFNYPTSTGKRGLASSSRSICFWLSILLLLRSVSGSLNDFLPDYNQHLQLLVNLWGYLVPEWCICAAVWYPLNHPTPPVVCSLSQLNLWLRSPSRKDLTLRGRILLPCLTDTGCPISAMPCYDRSYTGKYCTCTGTDCTCTGTDCTWHW